MSIQLKLELSGDVRAALGALQRQLGDLTSINKKIAAAEEELFRTYIRTYARDKHATARRLGATPTGFYERAAESPEGSATSFGVTITLSPREAFARAFGDIEITPRNGKKWLTIPATATAYGRRAGEIADLTFVPLGNNLAALMKRAQNGEWTVFYWLKKKITQKQNRRLLPSDALIGDAAETTVVETLESVVKGGTA